MTFKPDMKALTDWVMSGAMASDLDQAVRDGLSEQHPEIPRAFAHVFSTTEGRLVLDYLAKTTALRAPVDHRLSGADYAAYAQLRHGQNQTFALIVELMELGNTLERNPDGRRSTSDGDGTGPDRDDTDGAGWSDLDPDGDIAVT